MPALVSWWRGRSIGVSIRVVVVVRVSAASHNERVQVTASPQLARCTQVRQSTCSSRAARAFIICTTLPSTVREPRPAECDFEPLRRGILQRAVVETVLQTSKQTLVSIAPSPSSAEWVHSCTKTAATIGSHTFSQLPQQGHNRCVHAQHL